MKAGELTIDYVGTTLTAIGVGATKRTVTMQVGSILHEAIGDSFRTVIGSRDRTQTIVLKGNAEVEIS